MKVVSEMRNQLEDMIGECDELIYSLQICETDAVKSHDRMFCRKKIDAIERLRIYLTESMISAREVITGDTDRDY